jgi:hypothetical protein
MSASNKTNQFFLDQEDIQEEGYYPQNIPNVPDSTTPDDAPRVQGGLIMNRGAGFYKEGK